MRNKQHLTDIYYHKIQDELNVKFNRYGLLENAVRNYSGGIVDLQRRVKAMIVRSRSLREELSDIPPSAMYVRESVLLIYSGDLSNELILLLKDVHAYLRDVNKHLPENNDECF